MSELAPGLQVTPVVSLTRQLGRGGMGSVWLAHHHTLDTAVVVKFLATTLLSDEPSRERFAREATAAASVKSPHVVQTLDHGVTADGTPFIVMEHLEGEDLGKVLRSRLLTPVQVASVVEQVARALDAAHRHGVIHRDVKPANIFLTDVGARDPFVKLLDFGVAKTIQNQPLTTSGELLGTPVYMSPEQVTGAGLDARSDLWSLGVVAFRCLTGKRPFNGDSVAAVAYQIVHAPIAAPSSLSRGVSPAVDAWFATACHRDRDKRFGSARAMADSLWAALDIQRASDWSGETPPVSPLVLAETMVEGRGSQSSLTGPHPITPHPSGAMELTGGSLRSSVATVPPRKPARWLTLALLAAIPMALVIGFGASHLFEADTTSQGASARPAPPDDDPRDERLPGASAAAERTAEPSAPARAEASTTPSASAAASVGPVVPRPGRRVPVLPRPKAVDPDDLGF